MHAPPHASEPAPATLRALAQWAVRALRRAAFRAAKPSADTCAVGERAWTAAVRPRGERPISQELEGAVRRLRERQLRVDATVDGQAHGAGEDLGRWGFEERCRLEHGLVTTLERWRHRAISEAEALELLEGASRVRWHVAFGAAQPGE